MIGIAIGDSSGLPNEVKEIQNKQNQTPINYEERVKILDRNIPLIKEDSTYSDDTILSTAIEEALLTDLDYEKHLKSYTLRELSTGLDGYLRPKFSINHIETISGRKKGDSYGTGGAMRSSPIALFFDEFNEMIKETKRATVITHDHPEAIMSAQAVNMAVFLAKNGCSKKEIKTTIEKYIGYDLNFDLESLQRTYDFKTRAKNNIPQALYCFLIADDFEDAIRKAISIGGDSDTIAAITGAVSEVYYGIPEKFIEPISQILPIYIKKVMNNFYEKKGKSLKLFLK